MLSPVSNSGTQTQTCAAARPAKPGVADRVILGGVIPLGSAAAMSGLMWSSSDRPVAGAVVGAIAGLFGSALLGSVLFPGDSKS